MEHIHKLDKILKIYDEALFDVPQDVSASQKFSLEIVKVLLQNNWKIAFVL